MGQLVTKPDVCSSDVGTCVKVFAFKKYVEGTNQCSSHYFCFGLLKTSKAASFLRHRVPTAEEYVQNMLHQLLADPDVDFVLLTLKALNDFGRLGCNKSKCRYICICIYTYIYTLCTYIY